jgi:hypothetical protein
MRERAPVGDDASALLASTTLLVQVLDFWKEYGFLQRVPA